MDGGVLGGTVKANVYGMSGMLVKHLEGAVGAGTVMFDGSGLASGLYFVIGEVRDSNGQVTESFNKKVIILK